MAGLVPAISFLDWQISVSSDHNASTDPDTTSLSTKMAQQPLIESPMSIATSAFIAGMPKAELHLHIEGTLTQEKRKFFAERNGHKLEAKSFAALNVESPAAADAPEAAKQRGIAQYKMFLDLYYAGLRVLQTERDYFDRNAAPYREHIIGLGLDSVEDGHPPLKFLEAYECARAEDYRLTAHCDVDMIDAAKHMWQCLDELRVERIDHGINVLDDDRLVETVRERNICLTACPTWRNGDPGPRRVDRIRRMFDLGLPVTLNTDDPGYFISGMMNDMLPPVAALGKFSATDLSQLMINAFNAAWLSREKRDKYIGMVRSYLAANNPDRIVN
jgi:adenosine deaminase